MSNDMFNIDSCSVSFSDFLFKNKGNRISIGLYLLAILLQFSIFKYFYPYPAFINGDSYEYIQGAFYNLKIFTYPIGYSRFLRLFSVFFTNSTALVAFQYIFVHCCILVMLYTIFYFFRPSKLIRCILLILLAFNFVTLYLANYISSDCLFISLSVCWFTTILWLLLKPSRAMIFVHALTLLLAVMVRYYALFYPVISIVVLLLGVKDNRMKIGGVGLTICVLLSFVMYTSFLYEKKTGVFQFSPFSGWQMANNGMYVYKFIDSSSRKELPAKFKEIDTHVRRYFDTSKMYAPEYPEKILDVSAIYMWSPSSPLRIYMNLKHGNDTTLSEFQRWSKMAPLYNEYGMALIHTYPGVFAKRYMFPNLIRYYVPPVEFLSSYGYRMDTIPPIVQSWFHFNQVKLTRRMEGSYVDSLDFYPIVCGIMNAVYLMMCVSFLVLKGRNIDKKLFQVWLVFTFFWITNMLFSVFASPIALRFQVFPLILCIVSNFLLLDFMLKMAKAETKRSQSKVIPTTIA